MKLVWAGILDKDICFLLMRLKELAGGEQGGVILAGLAHKIIKIL